MFSVASACILRIFRQEVSFKLKLGPPSEVPMQLQSTTSWLEKSELHTKNRKMRNCKYQHPSPGHKEESKNKRLLLSLVCLFVCCEKAPWGKGLALNPVTSEERPGPLLCFMLFCSSQCCSRSFFVFMVYLAVA